MANKNLMDIYIQQINDFILPTFDFERLDSSCNSDDRSYASDELKRLHDVFVDIYGTDILDESYGDIFVPAVVRGRESGRLAVALVQLDLTSSGEHWDTAFCTHRGVTNQSDADTMSTSDISNQFIPYDYWYTVKIPGDIHISKSPPQEVQELLDACKAPELEMRMQ